jgi:N-acetylglucosaminyldiphosphoundecaprenol N-acetyl-beta-D-mannosaminyltransferase
MKQYPTINFLSIPISNVTMPEIVALIDNCIKAGEHIDYVDINASKVTSMRTDKTVYDNIFNANLIAADGQSVVWASYFLDSPLRERIAGVDLMQKLVELAYREKYTCYFLGAKESVVSSLMDLYTQKYGKEIIAGYRNGYFKSEDEREIVDQIIKSKANFLFVGITSPKKEIFLNAHKDALSSVNFTMGVGGSFDVISGFTKRAPLWMQKIGMEWFYRFLQEPRRMWKRYLLSNSQFIQLVMAEKFRRKK